MKVTVDVRTLMTNLETLNPQADLTLVKVYLFDLAMGRGHEADEGEELIETREISETEAVLSGSLESELTSGTPLVDSILNKSSPKVGLLQRTAAVHAGASSKSKRVIVNTGGAANRASVGKLSREEKLAKRAEYDKAANTSSKDLIAQLTKDLEKPRGENGQAVDEGSDGGGGGGGGELELG